MLPCGQRVAALGQGTWNIGDDARRRADEIAGLRRGIELGHTLIDTAEMYGDGRSEALVGEAIAGRRDEVFLVSKVYPHNASRTAMPRSCEASLKRLGVETIDLYLLHWPGAVPLAETVEAFQALQRAGKIRHWGVSNFDVADLDELAAAPGGDAVASNQVLYNVSRRGIEFDLLPTARERGLMVMAYTPIEQGRILEDAALRAVAERHGATAAQIALAWVIRRDGVVAIPRASSPAHVRDNARALDVTLSAHDLEEIDRAFPPPKKKRSLEMI
jgi:diketogulonate reductase-like aldo/keto reductase